MESRFSKRKGKRDTPPPLFFPGTGLPAGRSPGSRGLRGSAPPGTPRFPPGALRRGCVSTAGDKASSLPKTFFFLFFGRAALPARPLPVLWATYPHAHPGRGPGAREVHSIAPRPGARRRPGGCNCCRAPGLRRCPRLGGAESGHLQLPKAARRSVSRR